MTKWSDYYNYRVSRVGGKVALTDRDYPLMDVSGLGKPTRSFRLGDSQDCHFWETTSPGTDPMGLRTPVLVEKGFDDPLLYWVDQGHATLIFNRIWEAGNETGHVDNFWSDYGWRALRVLRDALYFFGFKTKAYARWVWNTFGQWELVTEAQNLAPYDMLPFRWDAAGGAYLAGVSKVFRIPFRINLDYWKSYYESDIVTMPLDLSHLRRLHGDVVGYGSPVRLMRNETGDVMTDWVFASEVIADSESLLRFFPGSYIADSIGTSLQFGEH